MASSTPHRPRRPARRRPAPVVNPLPFRVPRAMWPRTAPLYAVETALQRAGLGHVAGADEAGRGACAGPLVVAACVLPAGARGVVADLDDSKALTAATRERLYGQIVKKALAYHVVVIPAAEIDAWGLHVANLAGMRRAVGALGVPLGYALTDGFPVPGLAVPSTAVWKGDATVACVAAASILAKVTRDRIMTGLAERFPRYEFDRHKGYVTAEHTAALTAYGPCPEHRQRYVNVRRAAAGLAPVDPGDLDGDIQADLDGDTVDAAAAMEDDGEDLLAAG